MRKSLGLMATFAAAAFTRFGGTPLPNLTPSARANHKKNWTGTPWRQNVVKHHSEARACARRLAFKERHGHFASDCAPVYTRTGEFSRPQITFAKYEV
jgi:hypothetical protein